MARNIAEVSIFGEYKQPENRLTAAFLQILKIGGEPLIREIALRIGFNIPSSEIEISTQIKEDSSVPDGQLQCNFSFCLYIESKIGKLSSWDQLENHMKLVSSEEQKTLLYLTGDETRPAELPPECYWINWEGTIETFREYLEDTKIEMYELLSFLIDQYEILITNTIRNKRKWIPSKDKVIIVAGSKAEGIAVKYKYYICQNQRQFQSAEYMAFYKDNAITRVFKIDGEPKDDIDLREIEELREYIEKEIPEYSGEKQKIFRLKDMEKIGPVLNDSIDKNGNPCPFTYGQPRYTTIENLRIQKRTSAL